MESLPCTAHQGEEGVNWMNYGGVTLLPITVL